MASVLLPIQSGFWLSLCPASRPLSTYLLSSWNRRQMDTVSSRPLPSPLPESPVQDSHQASSPGSAAGNTGSRDGSRFKSQLWQLINTC